MAPPRLLLVEDDSWVRDSVASVFSSGTDRPFALAGACATGEEALALESSGAPFDLALVDLGLPGVSGVELIAALRHRRPSLVCVAFTVIDEPRTIFAALRAGAQGYLLKSTPVGKLAQLLREAFEGVAPMSVSVARIIAEALPGAEPEPPRSTLSVRETEVLAVLAKGLTYGEAAGVLGIGVGTVQVHVKSIYKKLEVGSKAEAALEAVRLGLIR